MVSITAGIGFYKVITLRMRKAHARVLMCAVLELNKSDNIGNAAAKVVLTVLLLSWKMEIDQDETNDETVPESVGEASVSSVAKIKRTKKHTSPVWNYFEKCVPESNLALCLVCGGKYQHPSHPSYLCAIRETIFKSWWNNISEKE